MARLADVEQRPSGSEEQSHRQPELRQRRRGWDRRCRGGEEQQRCTHADRKRPEPFRAPTEAQERHTLPEVVQGLPWTPSRTHSPTRRATGHDRLHRVRSIHQPPTMPAEGAQMPHRARSGARGAATRQPHQDEPQPPRMTRRGCAAYLYEYGRGAQPRTRKPARRKG